MVAIENSDSIITNPFFFAPLFLIGFVPESKNWRDRKFVRCADVRCKLVRWWVHSRYPSFSHLNTAIWTNALDLNWKLRQAQQFRSCFTLILFREDLDTFFSLLKLKFYSQFFMQRHGRLHPSITFRMWNLKFAALKLYIDNRTVLILI